MEFESWHLWIIATIVFVVLEIAIPSFVMMSIGIGCFLAFAGALFNAPLALQLVLFMIGTIAGFVGVRPVMAKYAYQRKSIETNAAGLVGRIGKVIEEIGPGDEAGCVAIDGDQWKALSATGEKIPVAQKVKVLQLDSIVVIVEPLESQPQTRPKDSIPETSVTISEKKLSVRLGNKTLYIGYDEVLYLSSKNKVTFIVTRNGKEYIHDESLDKLDGQLPRNLFFRANRQFILSRHIISEIRPATNGNVEVLIKPGNGSDFGISVSRLKAHTFREWLKQG